MEISVQTPMQPDQVRPLALSALRIARWNARETFDPAALAELTTSMKAHGVQVLFWFGLLSSRSALKRSDLGPDCKVWYLVAKNIIGRENILDTFNHRADAENQAAAAEKNGPGDYEIVAGHRRSAALRQLKDTHAPAMVRTSSMKIGLQLLARNYPTQQTQVKRKSIWSGHD